MKTLTKEQIEWCEKYLPGGKWKVNDQGKIDVKDHVDLDMITEEERHNSLEKLPISFGEIDGFFSCDSWIKLTTLEGSPVKIKGGFYCAGCFSLLSLKGISQEVTGIVAIENCFALNPLHKNIIKNYNSSRIDWPTAYMLIHRPKLAQAHSLGLI